MMVFPGWRNRVGTYNAYRAAWSHGLHDAMTLVDETVENLVRMQVRMEEAAGNRQFAVRDVMAGKAGRVRDV